MSDAVLSVQNLSKRFHIPRRGLFGGFDLLPAVDDVSFSLFPGETLGIVGESGSGKSTLGRSILRLVEPTEGRIFWQGNDLVAFSEEEMRQARRDLQIIFQDPIASLDPRMTVRDIISEPLRVAEPGLTAAERQERVQKVMEEVGLAPQMINRYPHEFSGGQAQRIGVARAIITRPKLIVCDEPVSALDVSIQAQIVNLLRSLKEQYGLTLIFISHDLSVVRLISDRIIVLYLGKVVEMASRAALFSDPRHPYTRALLSAATVPDPKAARQHRRIVLRGDPPSPIDPPSGCVFRNRCPIAEDICATEAPLLRPVEAETSAACHFADRQGARIQS